MKYPCVVDKRYCKTPIHVEIAQEGIDKYGDSLAPVELDTVCNFQDVAKTVMTAGKKVVEITGTALFPGDIAPELPTLSGGSVVVFGAERKVERGMKARNPDGSVNYCRLDVK